MEISHRIQNLESLVDTRSVNLGIKNMFDGFWLGFIIGGIVCVSIFELIQIIIASALGIRGLEKEMKRKNDIEERRENRRKNDINERIEPKL